MNIESHNIMNGIRKWVMEDDWNTIRVHISHNDLDGHACHIMTRLATNVLNPNSKSSVTFWSSSAGKDNVERSILQFIKKMKEGPKDPKKRYEKGKKKLFLLITDLANFNPAFLNSLIDDGHLINYILIDHHQIADFSVIPELKGNAEEFQMLKNAYYVDDSMCAAKALGDAICSIIHQKKGSETMSAQGYENELLMLREVRNYTKLVDLYDRGNWGEWVDLNPDKIDNSVTEQLFFSSYLPNRKYKYVSMMANYFHTFMLGLDTPEEEKPFWCVDMGRFNSFKKRSVADQVKVLNREYELCKRLLRPKTISFKIPDTLTDNETLKMYEICTGEEDEMHYFTLISRELLKEHPDIDILMLIYTARNSVDMRTMRDDLNLFEIAHANGGGGHPKAAGFYLPRKED